YSKSVKMEVTVLSGKVAVEDKTSHRQVLLVPSQKVTLDTERHLFDKTAILNPEDAISWQEGKLIFEDVPLNEIAEQLSRKYGVNITIGDGQPDCRISAVFKNQTLNQILNILTELTNTHYKQSESGIELYGEGC